MKRRQRSSCRISVVRSYELSNPAEERPRAHLRVHDAHRRHSDALCDLLGRRHGLLEALAALQVEQPDTVRGWHRAAVLDLGEDVEGVQVDEGAADAVEQALHLAAALLHVECEQGLDSAGIVSMQCNAEQSDQRICGRSADRLALTP